VACFQWKARHTKTRQKQARHKARHKPQHSPNNTKTKQALNSAEHKSQKMENNGVGHGSMSLQPVQNSAIAPTAERGTP